jgi:hypothetical protein
MHGLQYHPEVKISSKNYNEKHHKKSHLRHTCKVLKWEKIAEKTHPII